MAAIQLHDEREFNTKQSVHEFLPKMPGAGCFLGPSGTFKTKALVSLLLDHYTDAWDSLVIVSPSVDIDESWAAVKREVKKRGLNPDDVFHKDWNEDRLGEVLDVFKRQVQKLKDKGAKDLPLQIIVLDDVADNVKLKNSPLVSSLAIRGRHHNQSLWCSTQHWTAVAPQVRAQFRFLCVGKLRSESQLKAVLESVSAVIPRKMMEQVYRRAVNDGPHSFLYLNLQATDINEFAMVRFEHPIRFSE
jgi:hypothetical protein